MGYKTSGVQSFPERKLTGGEEPNYSHRFAASAVLCYCS